jgi:hypothetical protein
MESIIGALQRVESLVGDADARIVLKEARKDLVLSIESLDRSAEAGNARSFRRTAHALAGVLSTFGFCKAYNECLRLLDGPADTVPDFTEVRRQVLLIASHLQNLPQAPGPRPQGVMHG